MLVLLVLNVLLFTKVNNLSTKINNINTTVKNVDQQITCGEQEVNPPNTPIGTTSCIGLKTQLDELLDKSH